MSQEIKKWRGKLSVSFEGLGKCPSCRKIIHFSEITETELGPFHHCPLCHKMSDPWSMWGHRTDRDIRRSTYRYIGPNGRWQRSRPFKSFFLERFYVKIPKWIS